MKTAKLLLMFMLLMGAVSAKAQKTAYAYLDDLTFRFCYDDQKWERAQTYPVFPITDEGGKVWDDIHLRVWRVVFEDSFKDYRPTTCAQWFKNMANLVTIENGENCNTSEVTDMHEMFAHSNAGAFDLSFLNTSKVTDMSYMFYYCPYIEYVNVNFDTSNVTDMSYMYAYCTKLKSVTFGNIDTSKVTNMQGMFQECYSLTDVDISNVTFLPSDVLNSQEMFCHCMALENLTVSATANNLDSDAFDMVGNEESPCKLFYPDGFTPDTNVRKGNWWIKWKEGYFHDGNEPWSYAVFNKDTGRLIFYSFTGSNTWDEKYKVYPLNYDSYYPEWHEIATQVTSVDFNYTFVSARPTSCFAWFKDMVNLTDIYDMYLLNTSKVTNMGSMFYNCPKLTDIELLWFNTEKVTDMSYMFYNSSKLTELDLHTFHISNQTLTNRMFDGCSVKTLAVSNTAENFNANTFVGLGTQYSPCVLNYPDGIRLTKGETGDGWFSWKGGYFLDKFTKTAYAAFYPSSGALVFYYDSDHWVKRSKGGTTYFLNHLNYVLDTPNWSSIASDVNTVRFDSSFADARPMTCRNWFSNMTNLTNIIDMESYLNTSNVINMSNMFYNCSQLADVDVSGFNTANVTSMAYMFSGCSQLTSVDVSGFNTANVSYMSYMFRNCSQLTSITGLTSFNTSKVTDMTSMFAGCSKLTSLNLSSFDVSNQVVTTDIMKNCSSLEALVISPTAYKFPQNTCIGVGSQSAPCTLVYPDGFTLIKDETGEGWYMWKNGYFKDAENLPYALLSNDGKTLSFCYDKQYYSHSGSAYLLNEGIGFPGWFGNCSSVTKVVFNPEFENARPVSTSYWFSGMTSLTSIEGMDYLNTSMVTHMRYMFSNCSQLTSIPTSFETGNVTDMQSMFDGCAALNSLDLRNFDTSKVRWMSRMFRDCTNLEEVNLSSFSTEKVADFTSMFEGCSSLTSLNLSNFTIDAVSTDYTQTMFKNCSALQLLTLPASAHTINDNACMGVGTASQPCHLFYPKDFVLEHTATGDGYYVWKRGYFTDDREAYAVLSGSGSNKTLTFRYDIGRSDYATTYGLNTSEDLPGWFYERANVTEVVFDSSFEDARPTSCYRWFYGMENLTDIIGLEEMYLNTEKVTNMSQMFLNCSGLTFLDVSNFDTSKVTDFGSMFSGCSGLTGLDVSNFDTSIATDMTTMFYQCSSLKSLNLSGFTFDSECWTYNFMSGCGQLNRLTVNATAENLSADAFTELIFPDEDYNIVHVSGVGTAEDPCILIHSGFTPTKDETGDGWYKWKSGYFMDYPDPYVIMSSDYKTLTFYCDNQIKNRQGIALSVPDGGEDEYGNPETPAWEGFSIEEVTFDPSFALAIPHSCMGWFSGLSSLSSITGLEYLNTKNVNDYQEMFSGCESLTSLDLSTFNFVSAYTYGIVEYCSGLETLTVPATAGQWWNSNACEGVGTAENPCELIYPSDMDIDMTGFEENGYFMWKGGYFKAAAGLLGDANGDGMVSVADVMLTVNKVMNKQLTVFIERNADVNNDGKITVADVMAIVKMVLNSGPKSAPRNAWQSMSDAMAVTAKGSELTLHLTGTGTYTASQMTLSLPEGCRLESARMVSSRSNGHSVQTSDLGNGQYRVVVYGTTGMPFGNSCSDLVRLNVKGNHHGDITLSDIQVVDYHTNTVLLSDVSGLATGIDGLSTDSSDDGDWYTTQGQRVTTPTRGIYIRNGQKKVFKN